MYFKSIPTILVTMLMHLGNVSAVEVGKQLPELDFPDLKALKGQYIYIDYWASWCGPCRQSFPWMNTLQAKLGSKGLKLVAVNVDANRADADKFLSHTPAQFTIVHDPQGLSAKKLNIQSMPTSMLVSPQGQVLFVHAGFRAEDRAQLEAKIAAAMGISN